MVRDVADRARERAIRRRSPCERRVAEAVHVVVCRELLAVLALDLQPRIERRADARSRHLKLVRTSLHRGEGKTILVARAIDAAGDADRNPDGLCRRRGVIRFLFQNLRDVADSHWQLGRNTGQIKFRSRGVCGKMRAINLRVLRREIPADKFHRRLFSTRDGERQGVSHERPRREMQAIDAPFAAGERHAGSRGEDEAHRLHDECAVARRGPREERIERAPVVVERHLVPVRVHDTQHPVECGREHVRLQPRDKRLAPLQRDRERIHVARLVEPAVDRRGQVRDFLGRAKVVVRLDLRRLRFTRDDEKARGRRAARIENADEMRPRRCVLRDLHVIFSRRLSRFENHARRVHPDLRGPRIKFSRRRDGDRRALLPRDGAEMVQYGIGGERRCGEEGECEKV